MIEWRQHERIEDFLALAYDKHLHFVMFDYDDLRGYENTDHLNLIAAERSKYFIAVKFRISHYEEYRNLYEDCVDSMTVLGTNYLDLLVVSMPSYVYHFIIRITNCSPNSLSVLLSIHSFSWSSYFNCRDQRDPYAEDLNSFMVSLIQRVWYSAEQAYAEGKVNTVGLENMSLNSLKSFIDSDNNDRKIRYAVLPHIVIMDMMMNPMISLVKDNEGNYNYYFKSHANNKMVS
jgi:aryl-alcohol dehydrogenase-like predicted oxidoreductase